MIGLLDKIGDHRSQLDGLRLYLPIKLQRRLGDVMFELWTASRWIGPCLRVVPSVLWDSYLDLVRTQISDKGAVNELIVRPSVEIQAFREDPRWHLPFTLAKRIEIHTGDSCWLCPRGFWIEIWKEATLLEREAQRIAPLAKEMKSIC